MGEVWIRYDRTDIRANRNLSVYNPSAFSLREKCPNAEFFLVPIFPYLDQRKLRIWTLFTQCSIFVSFCFNAWCLMKGHTYLKKPAA